MRNLIRALIAALSLTALPVISQAGLFIGVSVGLPPPALPVYVQPPCPEPGYMWMPGYWAWDDGYYWVPGTWVMAPAPGLLWTPGYWGWSEGAYLWHAGYWGPQVGFYGGINYGFGYTGVGYEGGYWHGRDFYYNRSVTNVSTTNITNVYNRTVVNNVNVTHVSFNGGAGGVGVRPTPAQISAEHQRRFGETPTQRQQEQLAHNDTGLRAAVNQGRPPVAATPKAGTFSGHGVVAARGAEHGAALLAARGSERTGGAAHVTEERAGSAGSSPRYDRPAAAEHTPAQASAPVEQRPGAHGPQYGARAGEHPGGSAAPYEGHAYQPRPEPQAHSEAQSAGRPATPYPVRPAPQYQPHAQAQYPEAQRPQLQYPQAQHPQPQYPQAQRPQPQYPQAQHPQPQYPQAQHPQPQAAAQPPRPAPQPQAHAGPQAYYGAPQGHGAPQGQGAPQGHAAPQGHGGQQAARPEHGGEHNRQG